MATLGRLWESALFAPPGPGMGISTNRIAEAIVRISTSLKIALLGTQRQGYRPRRISDGFF